MDIHSFIEWRWRKAKKNGMIFIAVLGLLQAIFGTGMFLAQGACALFDESTPIALKLIGATMAPFGWLIPLVAIGMLVGCTCYRRDLAQPNPVTVHGTITKCPPSTHDSGDPLAYQCVVIHGKTRRLTVPVGFWKSTPNAMEGQCQYLAHSRLVYTINGRNVWD
ncbi:MAG: hypothetical protein WCR06_04370 [bacterium]